MSHLWDKALSELENIKFFKSYWNVLHTLDKGQGQESATTESEKVRVREASSVAETHRHLRGDVTPAGRRGRRGRLAIKDSKHYQVNARRCL